MREREGAKERKRHTERYSKRTKRERESETKRKRQEETEQRRKRERERCLACNMTITVITRCFSSELRGCRSENNCLLCVCMRRAYGPLLLPLPVRSLVQHESTASTYAVLFAKTHGARGREGESERAREQERVRKRD